MTDTGVVAGEDKNSIDSDAEEAGEELTLDQRQDELKKSRWNGQALWSWADSAGMGRLYIYALATKLGQTLVRYAHLLASN